MGWLKDWFDGIQDKIDGYTNKKDKELRIKLLGTAADLEILENLWGHTSEGDKEDPDFIAAYDSRSKELKEKGAYGPLSSMASALFEGFGALSEEMGGEMAGIINKTLGSDDPELTQAYEGAMSTLVDGILGFMDQGEKKISAELRGEVQGALAPLLKLGLTFTVSTVLAELIHPTKEMGFGQISHFLYDTVGFKSLMDAYIAPLRTNMIELPTKYNINSLTQPWKPRMGDAVDWFGRGHIGDEGFKELMKVNGMEPEWFGPYKRFAAKNTSYFMLNAIANAGLYDEDKFRFWLSDAGYGAYDIDQDQLTEYEVTYGLKAPNESQIDFLMRSYNAMSIKAEWAEIKGLGGRAFEEGMITEDLYRSYLQKLNLSEKVIDIRIQLSRLKMTESSKALSRSIVEKLYRSNRITTDEFESRLKQMNYSPEAIQDLLYLNQLHKQENPQELSRAQIEGMYRRGTIDETAFRARLIHFNYSEGDIELLVTDNKKRMKSTKEGEEGAGS